MRIVDPLCAGAMQIDPILELEGYTFEKQTSASPVRDVYVGQRDSDGLPVVAKVYTRAATTAAESMAGREYALLERIGGTHVPRPIAIELCGQRWALVTEHVAGVAANALFAPSELIVGAALAVGADLAEAIAELHAARLVHNDLAPTGVVVDPSSLAVTILDSSSARAPGTLLDPLSPDDPRGSGHYLAPERCRGTSGAADFRSDIYAFGATFYEILAGAPVFAKIPSARIAHAHLTRQPDAPHVLRPEIPEAVSRIVLRCLEKNPDDRYQTATGLAADLRLCRDQWTARGAIEPDLELGRHDHGDVLDFPKALYGRETEIADLEASLETARTRSQIVLIGGGAGVGKSSLALHLERRSSVSGGHYASAKFDVQQGNLPYAGFSAALDALADQLLLESLRHRERDWSGRLRRELGSIARVLVDLAPNFGALLDDADPVPAVDSIEAAARICVVLGRLARALTRDGQTFVISLDDLQWADAASRALIREFPSWSSSGQVILLGTFRDDALAGNSPLGALLADLQKLADPPRVISLEPLGVADSNAFLAASLGRDPADTQWLAERLAATTANNPFYLRQMILHLRSEGLLRPGPDGWQWDREAILRVGGYEGAGHFLATKFERQNPLERDVLKIASCLGDTFDPQRIHALSSRDPADVDGALARLTDEGLLAVRGPLLSFVHDRIREAAASLWTDRERAELHARIVRPFLERDDPAELAGQTFELAEHVRLAQSAIPESNRIPAARCCLRAAVRALGAGSPDAAMSYLDAAYERTREDDWQHSPDLMFELQLHRAELFGLHGRHEEAELICADLGARDRTPLQRARLDAAWIYSQYLAHGAAVDRAIEAVGRLGIRIPRKPSRLATWLALRRLRRAIDHTPDEVYLRSPETADERLLGLLIVYRRAGLTLFRTHRVGMLYCVAELLRRIQASGSPHSPAYHLASAAVLEATMGGDAARVRRLSEQVMRLQRARPDPATDHRTQIVIHGGCTPWYQDLRLSIDPCIRAIEKAGEVGDATFQYIGRLNEVGFRFFAGAPLAEVESCAARHMAAMPEAEVHVRYLVAGFERAVRRLRGRRVEASHSLDRPTLSFLPQNRVLIRVTQMFVSLLLGPQLDDPDDDGDGFANLRLRDAFGNQAPLTVAFALLQGIDCANALRRGQRSRLRRRLLADRERRLRRWAQTAPENAQAPADMLAAELAHLAGHHDRAAHLFRQASVVALENGYRQYAAIATERLARMLATIGSPEAAATFDRAATLYESWGARAKVTRLRTRS